MSIENLAWGELSLATPAENLAMDQALLDATEEGRAGPTLRFWESPVPFVVLGYANRRDTEVNVAECDRLGIPILRRCSGGGTVLQGPGCFNYNLVLPIESHPDLESITSTNRFVMARQEAAITSLLGAGVEICGHTDVVWQGRKVSGNAQRRKRRALVFHGCFLLSLPVDLIDRCLRMPSSQPGYRNQRSHTDFLTHLPVTKTQLIGALVASWQASLTIGSWPLERMQSLVKEQYSCESWNGRFV